jgi:hypothetical protein
MAHTITDLLCDGNVQEAQTPARPTIKHHCLTTKISLGAASVLHQIPSVGASSFTIAGEVISIFR